ncbi:pro-neuregulin-4, membrane-bound isoform-like [Megalops cyprinoides]|uniref:pro-neuregulin-4, membrane-bound isoform-like n=1 Tax=Megalops cyprinoides TaxID=118141 RepID=UPI00186496B5|nr:pro-neuregulin-4, membrane-bound isoform-like [Megalops cyprinoides]
MSEHGDPCGASEAFYCLNGGTCFKIPSVSTPRCVCHGSFKGSRCDQFQLFRSSQNSEDGRLIAAIVIVVLLILVVLAVIIYCSCKVWRERSKSLQGRAQYKTVKPPA